MHPGIDGGGVCEALATCFNMVTCSETSISRIGACRVTKFGDFVQLFVYFLIMQIILN